MTGVMGFSHNRTSDTQRQTFWARSFLEQVEECLEGARDKLSHHAQSPTSANAEPHGRCPPGPPTQPLLPAMRAPCGPPCAPAATAPISRTPLTAAPRSSAQPHTCATGRLLRPQAHALCASLSWQQQSQSTATAPAESQVQARADAGLTKLESYIHKVGHYMYALSRVQGMQGLKVGVPY